MEETTVWVKDTSWVYLDQPKKCRRMIGKYRVCGGESRYAFKRPNGYWAYCQEHMYGRRIFNGIIEIQVSKDSISAKRGYA
jgi:hypothetical protein